MSGDEDPLKLPKKGGSNGEKPIDEKPTPSKDKPNGD